MFLKQISTRSILVPLTTRILQAVHSKVFYTFSLHDFQSIIANLCKKVLNTFAISGLH